MLLCLKYQNRFAPNTKAQAFSSDRPRDGKEDLGPHAYAIQISSYSFHARVQGDLSVSIRLAFPCECGSA